MENTALGELIERPPVNLEIDLIARYVERMLSAEPLEYEASQTPSCRSPRVPEDIVDASCAAGRMVILVDEEDRENEGDLVLAADHVTPESHQLHGAPSAAA